MGRAIGRSWTRNRSAIPPSRSRASWRSVQIGSSERFPLVATTGNPTSRPADDGEGSPGAGRRGTGCRAPPMGRGRRSPGAPARSALRVTPAATPRAAQASRRREARSREGYRTANGLSSRPFRSRSSRTARSERASTIRWKPPTPWTATIAPSRRAHPAARSAASCVADTAPAGVQSSRWGPHAGHAVGCAWKRRSRGSSNSDRHRSQSAKPFIVVRARSYGSDSRIE